MSERVLRREQGAVVGSNAAEGRTFSSCGGAAFRGRVIGVTCLRPAVALLLALAGLSPNDDVLAAGARARGIEALNIVDGRWTWVSGSDTVVDPGHYGIYGTQGMAAPENVPGSRQLPVSWTDAGGDLWLFGGRGYAASGDIGFLNDLWKWDGARWTWVSGSSATNQYGTYGSKGVPAPTNAPGARIGASTWTDASGNLWLFGGLGCAATGQGRLNDLWKWDGGSWTWVSGSNAPNQAGTYGVKGVAAPGNVPGARHLAVSWTDASGSLWLFGGSGPAPIGSSNYLNDLWKWAGGSWTWVSGSNTTNQLGTYGIKGVAASGNVPGARNYPGSWKDANGSLWLFGGYGYAASGASGYLNDLWKWAGGSWTWVSGSNATNQAGAYGSKGVADPANVPGSRQPSVSWTDAEGDFWLFGGSGYAASGGSNYLNDLWTWDGADWTWVNGSNATNQSGTYGTKGIQVPENVPGARSASVSWTDASGSLWLFGGDGYAASGAFGRLNDLWVYGPACSSPPAPTAGNGGAVCEGGTIALTASTVPGATYSWTGPNGYSSSQQNPTITNATAAKAGTYRVTATLGGCVSPEGSTDVVVLDGPATPAITAPASLWPEQPFRASVPAIEGVTYSWSVTNGTVTAGVGTSEISVTAGGTGPVGISVVETLTQTGCPSGEAVVSIPVALAVTRNVPVPPCRLFDTRNSGTAADAASPALEAGETRTFAIGTRCGIDVATARSLSVNVTVANATAAGELAVYRGDLSEEPVTSAISFRAGATRANNGLLELSRAGDGTFKVTNRSTGTVHFILDVNGVMK